MYGSKCTYMYMYMYVSLLQPPPLRVLLLGPRGSGKTDVGRRVASTLGVFHIAFRDYLQEQLLTKMKRPPLVHEDEWDPGEEEEEEKEQEEGEEETGLLHTCTLYMYMYIHVWI